MSAFVHRILLCTTGGCTRGATSLNDSHCPDWSCLATGRIRLVLRHFGTVRASCSGNCALIEREAERGSALVKRSVEVRSQTQSQAQNQIAVSAIAQARKAPQILRLQSTIPYPPTAAPCG